MKKPHTGKAGPRYRIRSTVAHRELEGQILILSPDDPTLWTVNETGRFIWRRLLRGVPKSRIVDAFRREFGVAAVIAERDVEAFLDSLVKRRIIGRT